MTADTNNRTRYNIVAVSLHWLIAALIIFMVIFGEDLIRGQKETFYPSIHASIGISIFALSAFRLFWRWRNPPPALPLSMKPWEKTVSHVTHLAFYVLMLGLPLSGWFAFSGVAAEHPELSATSYFGVFPIMQFSALADLPFSDIHEIGSKLMIVLIILHVAAALFHQFYKKDGLLKRMSLH